MFLFNSKVIIFARVTRWVIRRFFNQLTYSIIKGINSGQCSILMSIGRNYDSVNRFSNCSAASLRVKKSHSQLFVAFFRFRRVFMIRLKVLREFPTNNEAEFNVQIQLKDYPANGHLACMTTVPPLSPF